MAQFAPLMAPYAFWTMQRLADLLDALVDRPITDAELGREPIN